ncbi:MAG: hypothetical protein A2X32_08915 [Elusimicrobia bacterium GWC2_64_44]|nr:MAG: hypothetical protein A2X32_08915 [Elusimicrobia bacterium GWC2_64_44]
MVRFLKGSIKIALQRESFARGELVEGTFALEAKKEIHGNRLVAALVATETYTERNYKGRSQRRTREVYRASQIVEEARVYPAGFTANYNFKIALPAGEVREGNSILGGALSLLTGFGSRVEWRVQVSLDAEGVDLAASRRIYVG